ncbi:FUSC family protein [Aeromonas fluvialis]|uniref:FUSC family protein n=1 Tax=Aeromonas fluvialis TaxID=591962 RepID=UPI0005AB7D82|nr:FUSC family protein [Aeromonas fluvialis]
MLNRRVKNAIKAALAIVLATGIAMALGWDKPVWAMISAFLVNQGTHGASLKKSGLRLLGTLFGAFLAILLAGLFPQERWAFIGALSLFLLILTYKSTTSPYSYAYVIAGSVAMIIITYGGMNGVTDFTLIMFRLQETMLGVLSFILVDIFLWPEQQQPMLRASAKTLLMQLREVLQANTHNARDGIPIAEQDGQNSPRRLLPLIAHFRQSYEIVSMETMLSPQEQRAWKAFPLLIEELLQALSRIRWHLDLVQEDDRNQLPFDSLWERVDFRLQHMIALQDGDIDEVPPHQLPSIISHKSILASDHRAASASLEVAHQLELIDNLSSQMLECYEIIFMNKSSMKAPLPQSSKHEAWLDLEKAMSSLVAPVTLWVCFLIWVYVRVPSGAMFILLTTNIAIALTSTPMLPAKKFIVPLYSGLLLALLQYIFIMPLLTEFYELAILLFIDYFLIFWLFDSPAKAIIKLGLGLGGVLVLGSAINRVPIYDPLPSFNMLIMLAMVFTLYPIISNLLHSNYVEARIQRGFRYVWNMIVWQITQAILPNRQQTWLYRLSKIWLDHSPVKYIVELEKMVSMLTKPYLCERPALEKQISSLYSLVGRISILRRNQSAYHQILANHPDVANICRQLIPQLRSLSQFHRPGVAEEAISTLILLRTSIDNSWDLQAHQFSEENSQRNRLAMGGLHLLVDSLLEYIENTRQIDWQLMRTVHF